MSMLSQYMADRLLAWWKLFHDGGPVMYPILLCSLMALTIIFERLWTLREQRVINEGAISEAGTLLKAGKVKESRDKLEATDTSLARILLEGMLKIGRPRDEIREAMEDAGRIEVYTLGQYINMLGSLSGLSTLLGFLGTVYGMIIAFNVIAQEGVGRAGDVAGGIAQALITTAAGLTVAIPAYIGYRYFLARVDDLMARMEERSIEFLDPLAEAIVEPKKEGVS